MTDHGNPYGAAPTPPRPFPANPVYPTPSYYTAPEQTGPANEQAPPARSRSRLVLILVAAVLFACAGVLAGLYVAADRDHEKAVATLADKRAELVDVRADLATAAEGKAAAERTNGDLAAEKTALTPCYDATQHYLWGNLPDAERAAALDTMWDICQ